MTRTTTILPMLHEPAGRNSATRRLHGQPVLAWTVSRLREARGVGELVILCWDDQQAAVDDAVADSDAQVVSRGARHPVAALDAVTVSRRWADGWRGGPYGTCAFDAGFHAGWVAEIMHDWAAQQVLLVDPAAALVEPQLIDAIVEHAQRNREVEIAFSPAAPGLAGVVLSRDLVERLAKMNLHAGRLLHYMPDQPMPDPIGGPGCVNVPVRVARTTAHFLFNSDRQINRLSRVTKDLNGRLIDISAEQLVARIEADTGIDPAPREVVVELNTRRATQPIYSPLAAGQINRSDLPAELGRRLIDQLAACDDMRITFGGVGDPLHSEACLELIRHARMQGIHAIHVETDLLDLPPQRIADLAHAGIDILSVHLPAMTRQTYNAMMGADRFVDAVTALSNLLATRQQDHAGVPLVVPIFPKCRQNFAEMEAWYDHWLRVLGSAVIQGPSTFGGLIPDTAVVDMTPYARSTRRLPQRLTVLSNGAVVANDEDVLGRRPLGNIATESIIDLWQRHVAGLQETRAHQPANVLHRAA